MSELTTDRIKQLREFGIYEGCLVYNRNDVLGKIGIITNVEMQHRGRFEVPVSVEWEDTTSSRLWSNTLIKV